ncbi:hypothetical protein BP5796_00874 [Coleophoma crateriformis]|uniref:Uncharacterized protein n=1 Tax=Coleophoma crateriformis TaxID=565419 RepID=A0A3D8T9K3_9HELO|nr:hypothetical protein BP5796_00874 [Coleophoma crateriformis]
MDDRKFDQDRDSLEDPLLFQDELDDEQHIAGYEAPSVTVVRKSRGLGRLAALSPGFWVVFSIFSILATRRVLTGDFPYPICFLVLLQVAAYLLVLGFVVLITIGDLVLDQKRECQSHATLSWLHLFLIFFRYILTVGTTMTAVIYSMRALMLYSNFSVVVMLPILTYAIDSILFGVGYACQILPSNVAFDYWIVLWALLVCLLTSCVVLDDYRYKTDAVYFAVVGASLFSVARFVASIGPQIPKVGLHTWDCSYFWSIWAGMMPCLFFTIYAAKSYEDIDAAIEIVRTWDISEVLKNLGPGVLTHVIWNSPLRSTLPLSTTEGTPYQIGGESVVDAIEATLCLSAFMIPISAFTENNLINWFQVFAFVAIIVISIGPRQICLYLPRFINCVRGKTRDSKWYALWQKPIVRAIATVLFMLLTGGILLFWTDTVAYSRSIRSWPGSNPVVLDTEYRAPSKDRLEIVIAHSEGDPYEGLGTIVSFLTASLTVSFYTPRITIYTKDSSPEAQNKLLDAAGIDASNIKLLSNIGGVTATFLEHILHFWDTLPSHTIFLDAAPQTIKNWELITARFNDYYEGPAGHPFPDTMLPSSTFLHLGDLTTCDCHSCSDTSGWNDTFHLVPSMFGAAHPGLSTSCKSTIITHGNNFVASASRIRGLKKDVWETLYSAISNEDLSNAWAHDKVKVGAAWGMMIDGHKDTLQKPFLGHTIERLWAILLQCSNRDVAWKCPNMETRWRRDGGKDDCGCMN